MNFLELYAISSRSTNGVCQKCGKVFNFPRIPPELGNPPAIIEKHKCECEQEWEISECRGNPLAAMNLVMTGKSIQTGKSDYFYGWLVRAL